MAQTNPRHHTRLSAQAQAAVYARVLNKLKKSIDGLMKLACELECERALALHRAGKNPLIDGNESIREARRRFG